MKNANLHKAKKEKNDEFYTRYDDIEKEIQHYKNFFKGKVVYCSCDDWEVSNFVKYFNDNFNTFGLERLISTCYNKNGNGTWYIRTKQNVENGILNGNGDFRSEESIAFLKEADVVVTNPPFSLFREYVAQFVEYDKKFLIIGNMNAITYKEIFPLIKEEKLWLGVSYPKEFIIPSNIERKNTHINADGILMAKFGNIYWFTNIPTDNEKSKESLELTEKYYGNEDKFPKYDNYDAINVDNVGQIPMDYMGVIGVPITFLGKWNPNATHTHNHDQRLQDNSLAEQPKRNTSERETEICENPNPTQTITTNDFEIIKFRKGDDDKDLRYTKDGNVIEPYFRILIRRKQKISHDGGK